MKVRPSASSISWIVQIFGWFSAEAALASRRKRLSTWGPRDVLRQEFERDKAAKLDVLGLVYDTHRAGAEFPDDVIMRDGLPDHWRESYFREMGKSTKQRVVGDESPHRRMAPKDAKEKDKIVQSPGLNS